MIKNREQKIEEIIYYIENKINKIDDIYRRGPSLYFYKRLLQLRKAVENTKAFLKDNYNCEILYATLTAWDMNSRGAKMKDFNEFGENICGCEEQFKRLEELEENGIYNQNKELIDLLTKTYDKLHIMQTRAKLVSNSKLLHFLFPKMLMPMDSKHTLTYLYDGNTNESVKKYIEIIELSFEIMDKSENWESYLIGNWNTTIPKMIDNAIILLARDKYKDK